MSLDVQQETVIDGETYTVSKLPARRALRVLQKIGRGVGPALAKAAGAAPGMNLKRLDLSDVGEALQLLFDRMTEDEVERVIADLLSSATVGGKLLWPVFDTHFQGRLLTMSKVVAFAFSVNYGDFRNALSAFLPAAASAQT